MTTSAERSAVRTTGRHARRSLQGDARRRAEGRLRSNLWSLHALSAPSIGVFVAHDGEPDLGPLVEELRTAGRTVALPVVGSEPGDRSMQFVPWPVGTELVEGRFGIAVPPPAEPIEPATLLVSLVAFDRHGNRMGRGAGYFDRYLAHSRATVIGVGFEVQRCEVIPTEPHDVALPTVVTDLGVRFIS